MARIARKLLGWGDHTCPRWLCFSFDNPIRTRIQDPASILAPFVKPGDRVLDIGPGRGYFTLPMSKAVGDRGLVVALDVQKKMLEALDERGREAGLANILLRSYDGASFGLRGKFDFVLMFWMFHEVKDKPRFLKELLSVCKPETRLLMVEPIGHVAKGRFAESTAMFAASGFKPEGSVKVRLSRGVSFRPDPGALP